MLDYNAERGKTEERAAFQAAHLSRIAAENRAAFWRAEAVKWCKRALAAEMMLVVEGVDGP